MAPKCEIKIKNQLTSCDGSTKYLFVSADDGVFEGIAFNAPKALNLCLSSQIGCAYQCTHCATGSIALKRNLSAREILEESRIMAKGAPFDVLFLGMGEPFLNLNNILESIDLMKQDGGLAQISDVLVGTSGVPQVSTGLKTLAKLLKRPNLCFSIHGVPNEVRTQIIPHTPSYGLAEMKRDILDYQERTGERVTLNYNPIHDINDSDENFTSFARWAKPFDCVVRIIPWNQIPNTKFRPSSDRRIEKFFQILAENEINYIYRPNYGTEIFGGCGQLGKLGYSES